MLSSSFSALERLVAAARPEQGRVAREVRRRHQVDVQRRFVGVAVDPARRRPASRPTRRATSVLRTSNLPSLQRRKTSLSGRVHPVVERPKQAVRVPLDAAFQPPVVVRDELLRVGFQIAVRVAHEPEAAGLADEHAADRAPSRARGRISPSANTVRLSILPSWLVSSSTTTLPIGSRFGSGACKSRHEAGHLDDPQPPVGIPVDDRRILDQAARWPPVRGDSPAA